MSLQWKLPWPVFSVDNTKIYEMYNTITSHHKTACFWSNMWVSSLTIVKMAKSNKLQTSSFPNDFFWYELTAWMSSNLSELYQMDVRIQKIREVLFSRLERLCLYPLSTEKCQRWSHVALSSGHSTHTHPVSRGRHGQAGQQLQRGYSLKKVIWICIWIIKTH